MMNSESNSSNVVDFESARARLRGSVQEHSHEVLDTHDAVLDISDVVFTINDEDCDVVINDDTIILKMEETKET